MKRVIVHYLGVDGVHKTVDVTPFHPGEIVWIGARKAGMPKDQFRRSIINVVDKRGEKA